MEPKVFAVANGQCLWVSCKINLPVKLGRFSWKRSFYVLPNLPFDVILRNDLLYQTKANLNLGEQLVSFGFAPGECIPFVSCKPPLGLFRVSSDSEAIHDVISQFPDIITDRWGKCDILPYDIIAQDNIPAQFHIPVHHPNWKSLWKWSLTSIGEELFAHPNPPTPAQLSSSPERPVHPLRIASEHFFTVTQVTDQFPATSLGTALAAGSVTPDCAGQLRRKYALVSTHIFRMSADSILPHMKLNKAIQ
uniref:Uncharacterized protein n=1 Tax=Timema poppense TaxID=170557 RepID=A0A7R9D1E9_TIMPO|nr:unnamed protein product [Timema poppensis]